MSRRLLFIINGLLFFTVVAALVGYLAKPAAGDVRGPDRVHHCYEQIAFATEDWRRPNADLTSCSELREPTQVPPNQPKRLPFSGRYRLEFVLSPPELESFAAFSAGYVGSISTIQLNGVELADVGHAFYPRPPPQRTLHAAVVPPGLLRPGTNVAWVAYYACLGRGGILSGPVGLIYRDTLELHRVFSESARDTLKCAIGGACLVWAALALALGFLPDGALHLRFVPLALACGLLEFFNCSWAKTIPELATLRWINAVILPLLFVVVVFQWLRPSRTFARPAIVSLLIWALLLFCLHPKLSRSAYAGLYQLYLLTTGGVLLLAMVRHRSENRLIHRLLIGIIMSIGVAAGFSVTLREIPLVAWSAYWWTPLDVGFILFLGGLGTLHALEHLNERRRAELAALRLLKVESHIRRETARVLHDELLQDIIVMKMGLESPASGGMESGLPPVRERLAQGLMGSISYIRSLAEDMQPVGSGDRSLEAALKAFCRSAEITYAVRISAHIPAATGLSGEIAECTYRICQEAIRNACKHSGAKEISVSLQVREAAVLATVTDAGQGFTMALDPAGGHGMNHMHERAETVGARLSITAEPGRGTTVSLLVPILDPTAAK